MKFDFHHYRWRFACYPRHSVVIWLHFFGMTLEKFDRWRVAYWFIGGRHKA